MARTEIPLESFSGPPRSHSTRECSENHSPCGRCNTMHETGLYRVYQGSGISLGADTPCPSAAKRQPYGEMGSGDIEGSMRTRAEVTACLMSV